MKSLKFALALGALAFSLNSFAQGGDNDEFDHVITINVPEHALVDVEGGNITVEPEAPSEAGLGIDFSSAVDSTTFINYSSIINTGEDNSRDISAQITNGTVPGGMTLSVVAKAGLGLGEGTEGTPGASITLSGTGQDIITGIGSVYTGTGTDVGHKLIYTLGLSTGNYADLDAADGTDVTITYTISDN